MRHFAIILVVWNFSNCGFSLILYLPFVLLRQKVGVFFTFGPGMYFQTSQVIFVLEWPKGEFVSILYWQYFG
jgi:hypothetical protein